MSDPLPVDVSPGAVIREPTCPSCSHPHLWLGCSCGCVEHLRNGID